MAKCHKQRERDIKTFLQLRLGVKTFYVFKLGGKSLFWSLNIQTTNITWFWFTRVRFNNISLFIGMVQDWTPCGQDKHCMNAKCVPHVYKSKCTTCMGSDHTCTNQGECINIAARIAASFTKPPTTTSKTTTTARIVSNTIVTSTNRSLIKVSMTKSPTQNSATHNLLTIYVFIFCQVFGISVI